MSENSNRNQNCEVPAVRLGRAQLIVLLSIMLLGGFNVAAAQAPTVIKVEPPSWWANHTINPVRLLIHGENLAGARVRPTRPQTTLSSVRINPKGTYLFVNVQISSAAKPGDYPLIIETRQ